MNKKNSFIFVNITAWITFLTYVQTLLPYIHHQSIDFLILHRHPYCTHTHHRRQICTIYVDHLLSSWKKKSICKLNRYYLRKSAKFISTNLQEKYWTNTNKVRNWITQWAKSPKKQSIGVYFLQYGTVFWVPN